MTDQIFQCNQHNIKQAIEEIFGNQYPIEAFDFDCNQNLPIEDAVTFVRNQYLPFIEPNSLIGKADADIVSTLIEHEMPQEWCDRALNWIKTRIPAIVIVEISRNDKGPNYLLGDGHHRLALANAIGLSEVEAIFVKLRDK